MLKAWKIKGRREAGCDEAGRGPLAGPVVAAAVVLPEGYSNALLNDSKQLSERQREQLRQEIEREAAAWAVAAVPPQEIDRLNILHASTHAMCLAVGQLALKPQFLLIDGNRFYNETDKIYVYRCRQYPRQNPPRRDDATPAPTIPPLRLGPKQRLPHPSTL